MSFHCLTTIAPQKRQSCLHNPILIFILDRSKNAHLNWVMISIWNMLFGSVPWDWFYLFFCYLRIRSPGIIFMNSRINVCPTAYRTGVSFTIPLKFTVKSLFLLVDVIGWVTDGWNLSIILCLKKAVQPCALLLTHLHEHNTLCISYYSYYDQFFSYCFGSRSLSAIYCAVKIKEMVIGQNHTMDYYMWTWTRFQFSHIGYYWSLSWLAAE